MSFQTPFPDKPIIGMVHMPALPGAPANTKSTKELTEFALSESDKLEDAGLDAPTGEPDFKVGGVPGGPSDQKAYAKAVKLCHG